MSTSSLLTLTTFYCQKNGVEAHQQKLTFGNNEPAPWTWAGRLLSITARALVVGTESVWGAANERDKGGGVVGRMGQQDPGANAGVDSRGCTGGDAGGKLCAQAPRPSGSENVRADGGFRAGGGGGGCAGDIERAREGGAGPGVAADVPRDGGAGRGRRAKGVAWLALWMCLAVAALPGVNGECKESSFTEQNKVRCPGGTAAGTLPADNTNKKKQCVDLCCATQDCIAYERYKDGTCRVAPNPLTLNPKP